MMQLMRGPTVTDLTDSSCEISNSRQTYVTVAHGWVGSRHVVGMIC